MIHFSVNDKSIIDVIISFILSVTFIAT